MPERRAYTVTGRVVFVAVVLLSFARHTRKGLTDSLRGAGELTKAPYSRACGKAPPFGGGLFAAGQK